MTDLKFDFDDVLIQPSTTSKIRSRKDINIYTDLNVLPLMSAPMDRVYFGHMTAHNLLKNKIFPTIPRNNINIDRKIDGMRASSIFHSISLEELKQINNMPIVLKKTLGDPSSYLYMKRRILVDMANGHMEELIDNVERFKKEFPEVDLMVGNIANPKTYKILSNAGADYIRISIGSGSACLTSQQTAIGYPMASLINECYKESLDINSPAKIVADGGFKKYSDIIKALSLGADYVMIGSILNKAHDIHGSCKWGIFKIKDHHIIETLFDLGFNLKREYRGMSTKEVQKDWGNRHLKTSEGVVTYNKIEYSLKGWTENFKHYLRSAMSYANCVDIKDFNPYNVNHIRITENAHKRFKK